MALNTTVPFETLSTEQLKTSNTFFIDWDKGRIHGMVDKLEAVNQFIKKALITPRFRCLIYDHNYGSEIQQAIIEEGASREYIETEMQFLVEDTLIHDERILKVYNMEIEFLDAYPNQDGVLVKFDVDTIYGTVHEEEVI